MGVGFALLKKRNNFFLILERCVQFLYGTTPEQAPPQDSFVFERGKDRLRKYIVRMFFSHYKKVRDRS